MVKLSDTYRYYRSAASQLTDGPPVPYRTPRAPRPLPRQMRPADVRGRDQNEGVRRQAFEEVRRRGLADAATLEDQAWQSPRDQVAMTGQSMLEATGLPSARRSARAFASGDVGTGALEAGGAALGVGGMLGLLPRGVRVARPARAAVDAVPRLTPPPREIGRASDGSILPIAPRQPFRNSLRGGSEDLLAAARSRPEAIGPRNLLPHEMDLGAWQRRQNRRGQLEVRRQDQDAARILRGEGAPMASGSNRFAGISRSEVSGPERQAVYEVSGPDDSAFRVVIADGANGGVVRWRTLNPLETRNAGAAREFYNRALAIVFDDVKRVGRASYTFESLSLRRDPVHVRLLRAAERQGDLPEGYVLSETADGRPMLLRARQNAPPVKAGR